MPGAGKRRAAKKRNDNAPDNGGESSTAPAAPQPKGEDNKPASDSPETQQASSSSESPPQRGSPPAGFDGNQDPVGQHPNPVQASAPNVSNNVRNLDLGLRNAFLMQGEAAPTNLAPRPKELNKTGVAAAIKLNTWAVRTTAMKTVHQYDVVIGSGVEKRGLNRRVWLSELVQKKIGNGWIYDGNKIAYCHRKLGDNVFVEVDLDAEKGRPARTNADGTPKRDLFPCRIKWTKTVPMQSLDGYLSNKSDWDVACLESMTFLDHLLREKPSQSLTMIKRNFFARGQTRHFLGGGIEAMKGVYVTIRPVLAQLGHPAALSINVDVANTTFWAVCGLPTAAKDVCGCRDVPTLIAQLRSGPQTKRGESLTFRMLRRLARVRVVTTYSKEEFVIDRFLMTTAREKKFNMKDPATGKERQVTVQQYMLEKHRARLEFPDLPLVKMTKGVDTCIPMELLRVCDNQRYAYKLSDVQTSAMIKFAVTVPPVRWRDIESGVGMLDWRNDPYLKNYGLETGGPAKVTGQVLPAPAVAFAAGQLKPGTSGRWDLRNQRFYESHPNTLTSWGVMPVPGRGGLNREQTTIFMQNFVRIFKSHGGQVAKDAVIALPATADGAANVEQLWNATGNANGMVPQLLIFIVPNKSSEFYARIKKSCDCRYGVVSQVLQSLHCEKGQGQYISNVCMKVNAKLGGVTTRAMSIQNNGKPWFTKPTMVIGVDVSHGAPGAGAPSIAAVTMSWDRIGVRYVASVQTNGSRIEMVSLECFNKTLKEMVKQWYLTVGKSSVVPQQVYYLRDGVSEGQYSKVLDEEIKSVEKILRENMPGMLQTGLPPITVLTCTKRHHVRFFPDKGDRNGNPLPGTLVEQGVTDPRDWDFYLCSHAAIKGTARPVHYTVLRDDAKHSPTALQNMLYEASYQYVRSTTPVSLHPAIYYAHLAAARATAHINQPSIAGGAGPEDNSRTQTNAEDIKDLIPMPGGKIRGSMWYV